MNAFEGIQSATFSTPLQSRPTGRASLRNPLRLLFSGEPWLALVFMLLSFVVGVFWFIVLVTFLTTGLGLAITLVGLPILVGTMLFWTYGARFERRRVEALLGVRIPDPYRPLPEGPAIERLRAHVRDPHVWLDLLYLFLLFPIGIAEFVVSVSAITAVAAMITLPIYFHAGQPEYFVVFNYQVRDLTEALVVALIGVILLLLVPYVFVGIGRGHAWLARQLLGVNREAELSARVGQLSESRSRAIDAALTDLQRIERDLHDGAQQRLVKLAMDLGMAREKIKTDPAAAEALIVEAHDEAKRAMAEIRDLARGILPAVLTDRGLDAAVSALAGRSPIPVTVDVCPSDRLPAAIETTAYFVVAEALTNIARHSQSTEAHVVITRNDDLLEIDADGGGVGEANEGQGSGQVPGGLPVSSPVARYRH